MPIRTPEIECMPREQLKELQSQRLVAQVARMYERVECFRNRMDAKGLKPSDIRSVDDLHGADPSPSFCREFSVG